MSNLLGQQGEELAVEFLRRNGYLIKERNFKRKWGELDIVAFDRKTKEWVFAEVKTISLKRDDYAAVLPEEELTVHKIKKLKKAILGYLSFKGIEDNKWRFDFIAIELRGEKKLPIIRHYKAEFLELL